MDDAAALSAHFIKRSSDEWEAWQRKKRIVIQFTQSANVHDVMRDQLEFLIEHAEASACGCEICRRYLGVRVLLLDVFEERSNQTMGANA